MLLTPGTPGLFQTSDRRRRGTQNAILSYMRRQVLGCVGLLATTMMGVACETCPPAYLEATKIFRARLTPSPGGEAMSAESTYISNTPQFISDALVLEMGLGDASSTPTGWARLGLWSASMSFSLTLPLPLTTTQTFMVVTTPSPLISCGSSSGGALSFQSEASYVGRPVTPDPRDAVVACLHTPLGTDCTRQTLDICDAQKDALARQAVGGTVTVTSIQPLRLQIDVTISDTDVRVQGADSRLDGTLLSLHIYPFNDATMTSTAGWTSRLQGYLGSYASRTIVTEWGATMTSGIDYSGSGEGNNNGSYISAISTYLHDNKMGSCHWPVLRTGDAWSITTLSGSGTNLSLTVTNA